MIIRKVGVIGCGLMGHGIVQVAAQGGCEVVALETEQALPRRRASRASTRASRSSPQKAVEKGKATERAGAGAGRGRRARASRARSTRRTSPTATSWSRPSSRTSTSRRSSSRELGELCKPETIFASNTSSFPIAEMAEASGRPERIVGLHFFNPVQLMRLVEVVRTDKTDDEVFAAARAFGEACGKTPVSCKDTPGFVVNRLLVPYMVAGAPDARARRRHEGGHRHRHAARLRPPDGADHADRLRRTRHDALDPRGLGRALSERARLRDPGDPRAEGRPRASSVARPARASTSGKETRRSADRRQS